MLTNAKMQTCVGILTFISMIDTLSDSLKAPKVVFSALYIYERLKFHAQLT